MVYKLYLNKVVKNARSTEWYATGVNFDFQGTFTNV